jgi:hypothetical protein
VTDKEEEDIEEEEEEEEEASDSEFLTAVPDQANTTDDFEYNSPINPLDQVKIALKQPLTNQKRRLWTSAWTKTDRTRIVKTRAFRAVHFSI